MLAMGAPQHLIDELQEATTKAIEDVFEVYAENWQTVQIFCQLASQWNLLSGMSSVVYQGLKYSSINDLFQIYNIPDVQRPVLFEKLQIMEFAALPVLNEK